MASQINYDQQPAFQAGNIDGVSPHTIDSVPVPTSTSVPFGIAVNRDGTIPTEDGNIFGVVCHQASVEGDYRFTANDDFSYQITMPVLRKGRIIVKVTETPSTLGGEVFVNKTTGEFAGAGAPSANFSLINNATFESAAEVGGFAKVRILFNGSSVAPPPPPATATATAEVTAFAVSGFTITDGGAGYPASTASVTIDPPNVTIPTIGNYDNTNADGSGNVTITDGGTGYSTIPTVTQTGGAGSGATFTATIVAGVVDSIQGSGGGTGYDGSETFSIDPPTSTTAAATANVVNGVVTSITIDDAGVGYTSIPVVTIESPIPQ